MPPPAIGVSRKVGHVQDNDKNYKVLGVKITAFEELLAATEELRNAVKRHQEVAGMQQIARFARDHPSQAMGLPPSTLEMLARECTPAECVSVRARVDSARERLASAEKEVVKIAKRDKKGVRRGVRTHELD